MKSNALRNQVIDTVFLRAHTPEGSFRALIPDLDRIRALGADIVCLMPFYLAAPEYGAETMPSPYSVLDHRQVSAEYGSMDDFRELLAEIHQRGMKCVLDVVMDSLCRASELYRKHPEFFCPDKDESQTLYLDYGNRDMWAYQLETLVMWAELADGFRCVSAPMVPLDFWERARREINAQKPDFIWIAETVDFASRGFLNRWRSRDYASDADLLRTFDAVSDDAIYPAFRDYLEGRGTLSRYVDLLNLQEAGYPSGYRMMRYFENREKPRLHSFVWERTKLANYMAFLYFLTGPVQLYEKQEWGKHDGTNLTLRELYFPYPIEDLSGIVRRLGEIRRQHFSSDDTFYAEADDERRVVLAERSDGRTLKVGVFSLDAAPVDMRLILPDGDFVNLFNGETVSLRDCRLRCDGSPILFTYELPSGDGAK